MAPKKIGVAVIGCGVVGSATARLLTKDRELLEKRTGAQLQLKYIVVRNRERACSNNPDIDPALFETDLDKVLADRETGICVELVGGTDAARTITLKSLEAGKTVVTANKALLALHGPELMACARRNGVSIAFEASCAGGIPIIRALADGLIANRIDAFYGIVNGTCNYILTEMIQKGKTYARALGDAQSDGLAEADPTLDVTGGDSSHKLAVMSALAFGTSIDYAKLPVQGIDDLDLMDLNFGAELGYIVKLLAIARRENGGLSLRVAPAFISKEHPLAWVSGPFNAVSVYGSNVGHTMYYGRGAGGSPTASAVVSDIASAALGITKIQFDSLGIWPDQTVPAVQLPVESYRGRYYLRMMVREQPGMLGRISTILAEHDISISSALQKEAPRNDSEGVPIVITTHKTMEGNIMAAVEKIDAIDGVCGKTVRIGIVDEHEEIFG